MRLHVGGGVGGHIGLVEAHVEQVLLGVHVRLADGLLLVARQVGLVKALQVVKVALLEMEVHPDRLSNNYYGELNSSFPVHIGPLVRLRAGLSGS